MAISFSSVGHWFAAAASDVRKVETFMQTKIEAVIKNTPAIQKDEAIVMALTALIPGVGATGVAYERMIFAAAGPVLALANEAVHGTEDVAAAAEAKLLDVTKDHQVVLDLKQFITDTVHTAASIGYDFAAVAKTGVPGSTPPAPSVAPIPVSQSPVVQPAEPAPFPPQIG